MGTKTTHFCDNCHKEMAPDIMWSVWVESCGPRIQPGAAVKVQWCEACAEKLVPSVLMVAKEWDKNRFSAALATAEKIRS